MYAETITFYDPSVLETIDWENTPIYLTFRILNSVFLTLNWYFAFFNSTIYGQAGGGKNVPVYSCKGLGLYTFLLGWLQVVMRFKSMFCFMWFYAKVK